MSEGPLRADRAALIAVSAALATRSVNSLRDALERAFGTAPSAEVEEVLLQSYLFLGYPASLNGFALWREFATDTPDASLDDLARWRHRGQEVCREVYGGQYPRLRDNIRALHPDMERWMVGEGYGKVLGRPGLSLVDRELCIAALLAVLDVPTQLYSHLRGALNVGASHEEVEQALEIAAAMSTEGAGDRAQDTWRSVRDRILPES